MNYRSRKEQIQKEFARELRGVLKQEGIGYFSRRQNQAINKALRYAAMVGAAEARFQALEEIRRGESAYDRIVAVPILTLLGYKE